MSTEPTTFSTDAKIEFDALMKLSDFRFQRWQDRRKYEWQISLGVWALLAASILYRSTTVPRPSFSHCFVVAVLSAIFLVHVIWVRTNWRRNLEGHQSRILLLGLCTGVAWTRVASTESRPRSQWAMGGLEKKAKQNSFLPLRPGAVRPTACDVHLSRDCRLPLLVNQFPVSANALAKSGFLSR
jgi:hypothetical protein